MVFLLMKYISSTLAYMQRPYVKTMAMCLAVSYIRNATSSKEKTDDIITFTQFEEGKLLYETHDNAESSEKSNDN